MKYFYLKANKKNILKGIMLFVFILASATSGIAQTDKNIITETANDLTSIVKSENASVVSSPNSMNFVLWFMGSKQDPKSIISKEGINTKKQVITSGTAPNRLLIKAFLKKAVELDSMLA